MKLIDVLNKAQNLVKTDNSKHAMLWLLLELLNMNNSDFYLNQDKELDESIVKKYFKLIDKYIKKDIPVQYLIGESYFYGYKLYVNKNTLIPRVETEELVYRTIKYIKEYFKDKEEIKILDLATGSGAIGITIKLELPNANVTLSDISRKTLKVARKNIKKYDLDINVIRSNWFSNINEKFDVIISNPPYIPVAQNVGEKVLSEPHLALFSGEKGIDSYTVILKNVNNHLNEKYIIAFEHGYDQKALIRNIIDAYLENVTVKQETDFNNLDRYTFIFK